MAAILLAEEQLVSHSPSSWLHIEVNETTSAQQVPPSASENQDVCG